MLAHPHCQHNAMSSISGTRVISFNPMRLGQCLRKRRHGNVQRLAQGHATVKWESLSSSPEPTHLHTTHHTASPGQEGTCGWINTGDFYGWTSIMCTPQRGRQMGKETCSFKQASVYATRFSLTSCRKLHGGPQALAGGFPQGPHSPVSKPSHQSCVVAIITYLSCN